MGEFSRSSYILLIKCICRSHRHREHKAAKPQSTEPAAGLRPEDGRFQWPGAEETGGDQQEKNEKDSKHRPVAQADTSLGKVDPTHRGGGEPGPRAAPQGGASVDRCQTQAWANRDLSTQPFPGPQERRKPAQEKSLSNGTARFATDGQR